MSSYNRTKIASIKTMFDKSCEMLTYHCPMRCVDSNRMKGVFIPDRVYTKKHTLSTALGSHRRSLGSQFMHLSHHSSYHNSQLNHTVIGSSGNSLPNGDKRGSYMLDYHPPHLRSLRLYGLSTQAFVFDYVFTGFEVSKLTTEACRGTVGHSAGPSEDVGAMTLKARRKGKNRVAGRDI